MKTVTKEPRSTKRVLKNSISPKNRAVSITPKPRFADSLGDENSMASRCAYETDRRITRSRKALRKALIQLMEEQGYESATVNDLCACADLNRGTFYNHYRDKEDLLLTLENEILSQLARFADAMRESSLRQLMVCKMTHKPVPFLVDLFDYLREESDFLHAVMGQGGDGRFAPRLRDAVCRDLILAVLHERYQEDPTPFVNYYVSFYASAYLGVIQRWIETGMQESSEEMAQIALRLLFITPGESIEL